GGRPAGRRSGRRSGERANTAFNSVDRHLLELLRRDGRRPAGALARAVGPSRSTVPERLGRLRRQGVSSASPS
ncbi:Lrp/AsnC family transcriptional regulator, partial [Escherichia coli]|uniref:Lrp/AsnC family transcriptional regulator n=1 Tax=Escherichia coli TaxID=562 RepID=UPI0013D1CF36